MNKKLFFTGLLFLCVILFSSFNTRLKNLYDFKAKTIDGADFDFTKLKGKKVLIVNTASMCGFTPQYKDLEKLYKDYGGDKFTIIGFPANNFGQQEPGPNDSIKVFCTKNYGVTFQMMSKISVKGDDMDPIYHWLTEKIQNGVQDAPVKWNFQKFMIDENGNWAGVAMSQELPESDKIVNWIKGTTATNNTTK
ncbi:MAG TPA: glutathione peroxidase [Bacteroidia bacterium]|jgi:glutathione peroxidase|nr:glutathione peroxidase [Bacteroidia bacterium]